ncbi:hypothetical protein Patl1_21521 [Pistacia atlantica]|uniref:Uncharacterized protein n=1 Tax=Pistacia atlantica TaxID=434234 RepID=A0ACC1BM21_9ROSI|nr:hypothetical protein Patl1_21521 [Pistacia atlantica]
MSSLIPPGSPDNSPPAPPSDSPTTTSPSPTTSQPDQTTDSPPPSTPATPSTPSAPPPQSPPPAVPSAPPPSPPASPPPPSTTPPPTSPPPSPPTAPPPSPPTAPPPSPPAVASPPPENPSPPPPVVVSTPPPQPTPSPPTSTPPTPTPPQVIAPSPPPPANDPSPPSSNSPPPPVSNPPKSAPSPPAVSTPPPASQSAPPPVTRSPPPSTLSPPAPSVPSSSSPPAVSPPAPPSNSSATGSPGTSPLPSIPTEKPTAESTNRTAVTANTSSRNAGALGNGGAVAIGVAVGFLVLSLLVMAVWFARKQKRKKAGSHIGYTMPSPFASSQNSDAAFLRPYSPTPLGGGGSQSGFIYSPPESGGVNNSKSWFTYEELAQATNEFAAHNVLGEGGFGCVYKGVLTDGRDVAVKQLKIGGGQGEREFKAEVEIISRVHHRHLVSLVGYCISEHQRLLVYEYVPNNTLYYHLHAEGRPVMDWATRVKVAAGSARGIAYLHEDYIFFLVYQVILALFHRDIKSSNILLENNFEAKVADFGLAKIALELDSNTHVSTRVMGTFGWARPLLAEALEREDFEELVDSRLEKNYVASEMFRMIEAAAACVRHSGGKRPKMSQVVRALDSLDELSDLSNGMKPGQSEIFNSAQHSAQIRMFQRLAFGSQDYSSDFYNQSQSSWRSRESRDYGNRNSFIP